MKMKMKMEMKKIVMVFVCFQLVVSGFCAGKKENVSPAPAAVRTVVDMAGRTVTVPARITKIGTLGSVGVLNAFVELMGAGAEICNEMPSNFTRNDNWKMQYAFAPQIKGAPLFEANRELQIETILQTAPDVCFTMTRETAELLERNGVAAVYLAWAELDDVKTAVNLMGEVLDKKEIAADYIRYFDEKVAKAQQLAAGLARKKTVIYGSVPTLTQPHRIAEWWITQAGGVSVTNNGRKEETQTYTIEDLLKWNPDAMVLSATEQIAEVERDSRFAGITAVRNKAYFIIPTVAHVWGNRTVEQPLTIFWTMHKLYPELMSRAELTTEIRYFYRHFFFYDLSDAQIDGIIDWK
ncbi:MAG: ABC transporter substrate-binding protein [Spirochaetaceae bacterium]|jgi:iron complex transport system substrate-binding protein|nr:ABC transporter substrate-binding protein [Spirochaetaceae bacterium]